MLFISSAIIKLNRCIIWAEYALSSKEQHIFEEHLRSIQNLENELDAKYQQYLHDLSESMQVFMDILDRAFAPDIRVAFNGSVELAKELGVPTEEILDSKEKVFSYFLD